MPINITVRSLSLGLCLLALLLFTYQVMRPFLTSIAWAVILVYATWPLFVRLKGLLQDRDTVSALLMTLLLTAVLIIPLLWMFLLLKEELGEFFLKYLPNRLETNPPLPEFAKRIPMLGKEIEKIQEQFGDLQALMRERLLPWLQKYYGRIFSIIENVGVIALNLFITLLTAFFFYRDGSSIMFQVRTVMHQMVGGRLERYIVMAKETVKAVIYGIVLAAFAQAVIAGLGYWIVGLGAPILLGVLTLFFALIPFGTPLVWGALSIWLLLNGQYWQGITLAAWGTLVISWIDNIVRPLVIMGATRIPFLLVLFGVFGGLANFGFLGLFLGPVILAIGLAVWRERVKERKTESEAEKAPPAI